MTDRQKLNNKVKNGSTAFVSGLFLFLLLFVFAARGYGQQKNFEESLQLQLSEDVKNRKALTANSVRVLQLGNLNETTTHQRSSGGLYSPNVINAIQAGSYNEVFISQQGKGNISSAVQIGKFNDYNLILEGDENISAIIQKGNYNNIEQYLKGNGMEYLVTQQGNHNDIQQIENNPQMPKYQIHQRGSGISIRVENLSIY